MEIRNMVTKVIEGNRLGWGGPNAEKGVEVKVLSLKSWHGEQRGRVYEDKEGDKIHIFLFVPSLAFYQVQSRFPGISQLVLLATNSTGQ